MTQLQFDNIIKKRTRQHQNESFKFFWASLTLQIIVYSLLSHVIVKYWGDVTMVVSVIGILMYIPFTVVFMRKFKTLAIGQAPIATFVTHQIEVLESFYKFKRSYELVLIPVMTAIGTFITFKLYFPDTNVAIALFFITLASCIIAIRAENKKSFDIPLSKLKMILDDLNA